uniref:Uncharacterized protein n=1 Tax=Haliea sp. ETY-NAG TaxID=1055106 RepID=J7MFX9_9GAMM|nr:hypothetical protein [Haliea sp. ETY-NAG]
MPASDSRILQIISILLFLAAPMASYGHGGQTMEEDTCVSWIRGEAPGEIYKVHVTLYQTNTSESASLSPGGYEELCREIPEPGEVYVVFDIINHELRERTFSLDIYPVASEETANEDAAFDEEWPESKYTFISAPDGTMYVTKYFGAGSYKIDLAVEDLESIGTFDFTVGSKQANSLIPVLSPGTRYMLVVGVLILVATVFGHRRYLQLRSPR